MITIYRASNGKIYRVFGEVLSSNAVEVLGIIEKAEDEDSEESDIA